MRRRRKRGGKALRLGHKGQQQSSEAKNETLPPVFIPHASVSPFVKRKNIKPLSHWEGAAWSHMAWDMLYGHQPPGNIKTPPDPRDTPHPQSNPQLSMRLGQVSIPKSCIPQSPSTAPLDPEDAPKGCIQTLPPRAGKPGHPPRSKTHPPSHRRRDPEVLPYPTPHPIVGIGGYGSTPWRGPAHASPASALNNQEKKASLGVSPPWG